MVNRGVKQQFLLPASPWWGGFYERLARTVKSTLRKVLRKKTLTFEKLTTLLCEVESVINNRPLTHTTEDDLKEPLTPNHLIYGRNLFEHYQNTQNLDAEMTPDSCSKRRRFIQTTISHSWHRFKREYLSELRQANLFRQLKTKEANVIVGDVVLVKDDTPTPRSQWRIGKGEQQVIKRYRQQHLRCKANHHFKKLKTYDCPQTGSENHPVRSL